MLSCTFYLFLIVSYELSSCFLCSVFIHLINHTPNLIFVMYIFRMADYFYLRFYHKGQFVKNKYLCRKCTKIPVGVDVDTFSFSVLMEYVKDDLGYTEIGGIYVKKQGGGWKLVSSDADVGELVEGLLDGCHLDFYIDTIMDKAIEPVKEMQPHVIMRPRTSFFEGNY